MKHLSIRHKGAAMAIMSALVLTILGLVQPAFGQTPTEWDGLTLVPSKQVELVYVRPGASLAGYKRVRLDPVEVAFDKNWDPNRGTRSLANQLRKADMARIKADLAAEFRNVFRTELAKGGYIVVDDNDEDVLRVTARIIDLYINAPDRRTTVRSRSYAADAGRMTLVVELRDSVTGQVLGRAIDRRQGSGIGAFQFSSRMSNSADAHAIIVRWAGILRAALDDVRDRPETK